MRVQHCNDLQTFYDRVVPFLQQREAEHNALLGFLADLLREPPKTPPAHSYMGYVETDAGEIVAVAHFAGHRLTLAHPSEGHEQAFELLVSDAASPQIRYLIGPTDFDEIVRSIWRKQTGESLATQMPMGIYRLDTVIPPVNIPGTMRWTTSNDKALIRQWMLAFDMDVWDRRPEDVDEKMLVDWIRRYAESDVYRIAFWEVDGQPVSMAATVGRSPTGMRVGLVYTPSEYRGHGYASAITAALSQTILDSGLKFCTLATDLGNPTSNKIYQMIGYYPVADQTTYSVVHVEEVDTIDASLSSLNDKTIRQES